MKTEDENHKYVIQATIVRFASFYPSLANIFCESTCPIQHHERKEDYENSMSHTGGFLRYLATICPPNSRNKEGLLQPFLFVAGYGIANIAWDVGNRYTPRERVSRAHRQCARYALLPSVEGIWSSLCWYWLPRCPILMFNILDTRCSIKRISYDL